MISLQRVQNNSKLSMKRIKRKNNSSKEILEKLDQPGSEEAKVNKLLDRRIHKAFQLRYGREDMATVWPGGQRLNQWVSIAGVKFIKGRMII